MAHREELIRRAKATGAPCLRKDRERIIGVRRDIALGDLATLEAEPSPELGADELSDCQLA
jgi:hypothetical protein